jgi:hypothetical protein
MQVATWVAMTDDGTDPFDDDLKNGGDTEWDMDTQARCPECGYEGAMSDFQNQPIKRRPTWPENIEPKKR